MRIEEQAHFGRSGAQLFLELSASECGIGHEILLECVEKTALKNGYQCIEGLACAARRDSTFSRRYDWRARRSEVRGADCRGEMRLKKVEVKLKKYKCLVPAASASRC